MNSYVDRLRKIFRNERFWAIVEKVFVAFQPEGWDQLDEVERILTHHGVMSVDDWMDSEYLTEYEAHDTLRSDLSKIYEVILTKVGLPARITADELSSITMAQLVGLSWTNPDDSFRLEDAKRRVEALSIAECEIERVGKKRLACGKFVPVAGGQVEDNLAEFELWSSREGDLTLYADARPSNDGWDEGSYDVTAFLVGSSSAHALPIVEASLAPVVTSAIKTLKLAATVYDKAQGQPTVVDSVFELLCEPDEISEHRNRLDYTIPLSYLIDGDGLRILQSAMSAYFHTDQSRCDPLIERLHNATILLNHADRLEADPLALSISFAAIEALVCEGKRGPTAEVKEYVPTLLVQADSADDLKSRCDNLIASRKPREKVMKNLYDIRCDVLHGRKVHGSSNASNTVRRIAAGLIRAVSCWHDYHQRMRWDATWKEFMDEVANANRKPDIVVGIPDLTELIPDKLRM